jgi:Tol biopolymer transport system component
MPLSRCLATLAALCVMAGVANTQTTERVSVSSSESQANGSSSAHVAPAISADGRYVAFESDATNLVSGDTEGQRDVFVRDRLTGTTVRVSVTSEGVGGNGWSFGPISISADGRFVTFVSEASNLVPGGVDGYPNAFVRDRANGTTGTTECVNCGSGLTGESASISADGRFVAFAAQRIEGWNGVQVYVRDRLTHKLERISVNNAGVFANLGGARGSSISADGRYVVFSSRATNLVAGDTDDFVDIFVRDRQLLTTELVSVSAPAGPWADISRDGRFVSFSSDGSFGAFVRDRQLGVTQRVDTGSGSGPYMSPHATISGDGRFVAFDNTAGLVFDDTNEFSDIFVRDRLLKETERVSVDEMGGEANSPSIGGVVSANGRFVAFHSFATNLVSDDTNGTFDVFVRDRGPLRYGDNDLLVDLGASGLHQRMNNATWRKVHSSSPTRIASGDLDGSLEDEAIASFAGLGLFARYNNVDPWVKLHNTAPTRLVVGDIDGNRKDEIVIDLGAGGLWVRYNNAGPFMKVLHGASQGLAAGDFDGNGQDDLVADRGNGLWVMSNDSWYWVKVHATSPAHVATGDLDGDWRDDLIADLGSAGIWVRYNGFGSWVKVNDSASQGLATGDLDGEGKDDLLIDRGTAGLWVRYNNAGTWVRLHSGNPTRLLATDLDANGMAEAIASFPGSGILVRYNNAGAWVRLLKWAGQGTVAGGFD